MTRRYPLLLGSGTVRGGELVTLRGIPMTDCIVERLMFVPIGLWGAAQPHALVSDIRGVHYDPAEGFDAQSVLYANTAIEIDVAFPAAPELRRWQLISRFRRWRADGRVWGYTAGLIVRTVGS